MLIEQLQSSDSLIKKAVYNVANATLKLEFNSGILLEYTNVPVSTYDNFCKSESQIKFFNENIENVYNKSTLLNS
jgi:hypothetical protein